MDSEKQIEKAMIEYLNSLPGFFVWKNNSVGIYDAKNQTYRAKSNFDINGVSDIIGTYKGRFFAVEVKKPGGKATKEQMVFINKINKEGGIAACLDSLATLKIFVAHLENVH